MLKVVQDIDASNENTAGASLLDQIVRDGARHMLAAALQAEVTAHIDQFRDELDKAGRRPTRQPNNADAVRTSTAWLLTIQPRRQLTG